MLAYNYRMAQSKYKHHINVAAIKSSAEVIEELKRLDALLSESELLQVAFFNRAYIIITSKIYRANQSGYFKLSRLMDELEVNFAKYYFEALNRYVESGALPGPWQQVNAGWLHRFHPSSLSLMLGANAHINHDLPRALQDTITDQAQFKNDYFKVNQLLLESSRWILDSYYESDKTVNFMKRKLRPLYLKPTMWLILHWRRQVWQQFERRFKR